MIDRLGHKKSYMVAKQGSKRRIAGLAESPPDPRASERFRAPPYQAARLVMAQADLDKVRWIDFVDYLLQHVQDGSVKLSDPIQPDDIIRINDGHIDVVDYLANKYDIKRGTDIIGKN